MMIADAAARLEALGNPTRLAVIRLLVRAGDDGLPVGQVQERINVAASTLSHHLKALVTVGLMTQDRRGAVLVCRVDYLALRAVADFLMDECCADVGPAKDQSAAKRNGARA